MSCVMFYIYFNTSVQVKSKWRIQLKDRNDFKHLIPEL